jgi:transcriptional regulator with XRE-family HTH domain
MNLNFAENLKCLRKEKGVTQEKLSEALGVSAQSISRWELGICYPDIEMLPAIANYFGTTVDGLLSNDTRSKEKDMEAFGFYEVVKREVGP